jgi:3-oxoadipate enol-lactonase
MTAVDVAYEVTGAAHLPTVLLTGSLGSTTRMWRPQVEVLSQHYRVVAYDTRGHGRSPVPPAPYDVDDLAADLERLLDRLGVERAHAVGLSLGGLAVLHAAATRPERLDRVAVLCTSARFTPASAWAERAHLVETDGLPSIATTVVARWFTETHRKADPDLVAWAEAMLCSIDPAAYAACCHLLVDTDVRGELSAIRAPLLAIAGAEDPATPPVHLQAVVDGVPGARLAVVDDAAHLANLDQPEVVNRLILEHLSGGST